MKIRGFEVVKEYKNCNINIPIRSTKYSAAYDLEAACDMVIPSFKPGDAPILVPTGLKAYMMDDEVLIIVPRSSGPKKQGIVFPHSMGVIDKDYYNNINNEGHIFVQCINFKDKDIEIKKGDRIAQGLFLKYLTTDSDIATGERIGGFGTTNL